MTKRRANGRLVKIHHSYTVEEVARALGVHKNTVREWQKRGLQPIDNQRPAVFLGRELRRFLDDRRASIKRPCRPGQIYCVRCREPKYPAGGMVDYLPRGPELGDLQGICPDCQAMIYRKVSFGRLDDAAADLDVAFPQAQQRIRDSEPASENSDFVRSGKTHEKARREQ